MEDAMTRVAAAPAAVEPMPEADVESSALVQRPDGWYWLADDGRQEVGPFATAAEALADMRTSQDGSEPGAELRETENELGVADWIDPDTHAPAESHAPHIEEH
jgi:hypothetical protein